MKYHAGLIQGDLELLEKLDSKRFRCMCHRCGNECVRSMGAIYQSADCCESCTKSVVKAAVSASNTRRTVHGEGKPNKSKLYSLWSFIKYRCYNPDAPHYADYGGRGIRMADEWIDDYARFAADVGQPPTPQHTLDRYPNNDGNYEPGNVRWATRWEQANNRRDTLRADKDGRTQNLAEWAAELGLPYHILYARYKRGDRNPELFRPVGAEK